MTRPLIQYDLWPRTAQEAYAAYRDHWRRDFNRMMAAEGYVIGEHGPMGRSRWSDDAWPAVKARIAANRARLEQLAARCGLDLQQAREETIR